MGDRQKRLAVIGAFVQHSRSPLIHNFWAQRYNKNMVYDICPIVATNTDNADDDFYHQFEALFRGDNPLWGANITVPHKAKAFAALKKYSKITGKGITEGDIFDKAAQDLRVVNVIYRLEGRLCGGNTDGAGFMASIDSLPKSVAILGAGGAARAIVAALLAAGVADIRLCNRTRANAEALVAEIAPLPIKQNKISLYDWADKAQATKGCDLLVNTSALGMKGAPPLTDDMTALLAGLSGERSGSASVCDIVYTPLRTDLLLAAEERGLRCIDGLGMLLHQAALSFELWFGVRPPVSDKVSDKGSDELRTLLIKDLAKD